MSGMPRPAEAAYPFDARPLVEPVDPAAVRAYSQELRRNAPRSGLFGGSRVVVAVIVGVVVISFGWVFLSMFVSIVTALAGASADGPGVGTALIGLLPFLIVLAVIAVVIVAAVIGTRSAATRSFRLDRFARANGMSYMPAFGTPSLPGMIFSLGHSRMATDVVTGERPRFVEFANFQYTTGSGKNKTTHKWGYVAVKLDVPLPHIVLDATGNNGIFGSNLPATFDKDQRLGLEGDFDRYFSLFCPDGYEADALYLFTPDIMARFIDNAAALDVEIVDDWLFLYAKRDFSTLDPATWAWLFSVVGALLDKLAQWARWRDDRLRAQAAVTDASTTAGVSADTGNGASAVPFQAPLEALRPPPGVAPQGRRLQRGVPWVSIVVVGGFVLFWVLSQTGVLGLFFR